MSISKMFNRHFSKKKISIRHSEKSDLQCRCPRKDACIFYFGGFTMTKQEASERYQIPMHILNEYESWGLCGAVKEVMGAWQYDDTDLNG